MEKLKSRIAPTPSGYLHPGNAFNFLITERIVRRGGGSLMLRIDDLDALRSRGEYITDIFQSLAWLGIEPEEGPRDAEELADKYAQRHRLTQYNALLQCAVQSGQVFACTCSRKQLSRSEHGQYNGACLHKNIPLDTPNAAWRMITPRESSLIAFHDAIAGYQEIDLWEVQRHFIIRRRDGLPAYHIASLSDDVAYGINTIVRGADLLSSTAAQLYIAGLLSLSSFTGCAFYHHPLITVDGNKLSKSAGSTSLKALRDAGVSASVIRRQLAEWGAISESF